LLDKYRQLFQARLFHYCLMSNHFHLLIQLPDPRRLSSLMAGLTLSYTHHYQRRFAFVGHLWQGRFKSFVVQRQGYWISCGRYIERNPVEAGLASEPWQYRWSSSAHYALGEANALVDDNPCILELSPDPVARQAQWRELLQSADDREDEIRCAEWAVGDPGFREQMAQRAGRPTRRKRGRPTKQSRGQNRT
jgi:putative transposase